MNQRCAMDKRKLMLLATMTSKSGKDHEKHEEHDHHVAYGKDAEHGHEMASSKHELSKDDAKSWVAGMSNEDGSYGARWTMEQTKQVQEQRGIDCDPMHFWVVMNMMYSDYCAVAKKLGVDNPDFYAEMAKAFLHDKDAAPGKLANYYHAIVH